MAINFLIDYLTGQLAMVMNTTAATPPSSSGVIPMWFMFYQQ